jgi:hypothetical protein
MKHTLSVILLSFLFASCADNSENKTSVQKETILSIDTVNETLNSPKTPSQKGDTLVIATKAAIFIKPDSLQIEKRKKQVGEENFYAGADDYLFYMNSAYEYLDSAKIPIIQSEKKKFIKFLRIDKSYSVINIANLPDLWNIYFFDPTRKEKQIDMTSIENEYKNYFK